MVDAIAQTVASSLWALNVIFDIYLLSLAWMLASVWNAWFLFGLKHRMSAAPISDGAIVIASVLWPLSIVVVPLILMAARAQRKRKKT